MKIENQDFKYIPFKELLKLHSNHVYIYKNDENEWNMKILNYNTSKRFNLTSIQYYKQFKLLQNSNNNLIVNNSTNTTNTTNETTSEEATPVIESDTTTINQEENTNDE
ncbi:predicted protein [Naegleria gruberi]|uniref:Predicted protein n=1 Tax=Naegleria gruberi TaxID=5762 RepID=D2V1W6_NAEGR|nr:uncharacterized protein NAEGRDRAFT_62720 [Naegleria gruberi]EFC49234.1 predicted protein [Naegleria gruberi]|eukprot:XP_002681978.1 predicted protein [Naegleria gruberi strain NEG-M]